jgi:hypothetical protein
MAQKNRANMLTDIVSNIYNNLINFITGQNAQDRFVNLLDSSPNILSDASQPNGYVSTDANNEMFSSYYDEEISRADLITDLTANLAVGGKFYRINDAVGSTITLLVIAESNINLYQFAIDATTGEVGVYDITTDVFTPIVGSGNASITPITVAGLQALETAGTLSLTTLYIVTDATPYNLMCKAETVSQLSKTATIVDSVYSGTVNYDLQTDTWSNGTIYDADGNTWNGCLPSGWTLGTGCVYNIINGTATGTLGNGSSYNTIEIAGYLVLGTNCIFNYFGRVASDFEFSNDLRYTTVNPAPNGGIFTSLPNYNFLYNNDFTSTIFYDGTDNYHSYYDIANDRIVVTLMASPFTVSYIGGGGGLDLEVNGTPNGDQTLLNLVAGTNITLTDDGIGSVTIDASGGGGGDVYLANDQTFTGENTFAIGSGNDTPVTITKGGSNAALKVTKSSGSGDAIEVAEGSVSIADETASTIAHFDGSKRIKSLATSTYPSLTELARVKGVGSQVVGTTDTNTLTNKRITARTGTVASSATPTINTDNVDFYSLTAQTVDITSFTTNLSGTPTDGQTLWIAITGTAARAITWGASFESSTIALPTTTVTTARLDVAFIWNAVTSKWRCVGAC